MSQWADVKIEELSPERWQDLEQLFGATGACGGCWCMSWRIEKGEKCDEIKGAEAKRRSKKLVTTGKAHGLLAYVDGEPVGWCAFDRRQDYVKLDRAPSLKCDDADRVWSVPCFFISREFRDKGIGTLLLEKAVEAVKKHGGTIIEGYPARPYKDGQRSPDAFAWTGTLAMFQKTGFTQADTKSGGKLRMRRYL